jgi:AcrR family transcriptional regulator
MKDAVNKRDKIVDAAASVLASDGLTGVTVAAVATVAAVSSALVHYHFDTKSRLVLAAAERIADRRLASLRSALADGRGLQTVDAVWRALETRTGAGEESAWLEVRSLARRDLAVAGIAQRARTEERTALSARLGPLLGELGVQAPTGTDDLGGALQAALDGIGSALVAGEAPTALRAGYDALWLLLVAAGTPARRR